MLTPATRRKQGMPLECLYASILKLSQFMFLHETFRWREEEFILVKRVSSQACSLRFYQPIHTRQNLDPVSLFASLTFGVFAYLLLHNKFTHGTPWLYLFNRRRIQILEVAVQGLYSPEGNTITILFSGTFLRNRWCWKARTARIIYCY